MKLQCPNCGASVPASNIDIDRMTATCPTCAASWSFDQHIPDTAPPTLQAIPAMRPANMEIDQNGTDLVLRWRWFNMAAIITAVGALFWIIPMVTWVIEVITSRSLPADSWRMLIALLGVFLPYVALARLVNATTVRVHAGEIIIRHGPIPWMGNRRLDTASLAQLYIKEVKRRRRRSMYSVYEIHAVTRDGQSMKLVPNLDTSEQALYIEQQIEQFLRITDRPVRGELARSS